MATMESLAATMAELTSSMGTMFAKYGQAEQAHSEVLTRIDNMQNQFTQKFDASQREFKEVNADFTQKLRSLDPRAQGKDPGGRREETRKGIA
jgi:hypothetical protein